MSTVRSPARTGDDDLGAEDVADRGEVLRRVGLAQGPADRAAVADDGVGDDPFRVVDDREEPADDVGGEQPRVPGQRADPQLRRPLGDVPNSAMSLMSISHSGRASRSFIIGSRLCPPAMTRASGPWRSRSSSAFATLVGAYVVERGRYLHGEPPSPGAPGWGPGGAEPCP